MVWVISVSVEAVFTVALLHDSFLAYSVLRIRIKMKPLILCSQKRQGNRHLSSSLSSARMLFLRAFPMGFLKVDLAFEIISRICWLVQSLDCLLSLAAISVLPLLTLLCCWDYGSLPLCLPQHLPDLFEDCLFQGSTVEHGTIAAPHRARWCLHSWASAGWVRSGLTSPMRWYRDRLLWKHGRSSSTAVDCFTNMYQSVSHSACPQAGSC